MHFEGPGSAFELEITGFDVGEIAGVVSVVFQRWWDGCDLRGNDFGEAESHCCFGWIGCQRINRMRLEIVSQLCWLCRLLSC
jgi:hypothetical protein